MNTRDLEIVEILNCSLTEGLQVELNKTDNTISILNAGKLTVFSKLNWPTIQDAVNKLIKAAGNQ